MKKKMKFEKVESFQSDNGQLTSRYFLKALENGQAITIANTLRRVLLTELEGTAVSAVRVVGPNNEFGPLPGVREDILEIILNLKKIRIKGFLHEPCKTTVDVTGPAIITGNDIPLPEGLSVININHYIASISDSTNLKLELRLESGKGYILSSDQNCIQKSDFFTIDSIFTPILQVSYTIKDLYRFDERLVEDLELLIATDGSITPDDALSSASQKLKRLFESISVCEPKFVLPASKELLNENLIEELQLSVRAYNCLKRVNIRTIEDLRQYSLKELKSIKNFGEKCANEINIKLKNKFDIFLE